MGGNEDNLTGLKNNILYNLSIPAIWNMQTNKFRVLLNHLLCSTYYCSF